jgi:hypothetical protein
MARAKGFMADLSRLAAAVAGGVVTIAIVAGVAFGSRIEVGQIAHGSELRLALRTAAARLEICRDLSAEELEKLPEHFRQRSECDEIPVDYRLEVDIDGERRIDRRISHRGVRRSRPLAIDEVVALSAGSHRLSLSFLPQPPAGLESVGESAKAAQPFTALAAPEYRATIEFLPGRAVLAELDERGRFVVRGETPR